jgi:anti-sigma factor RsiW
MNCRKVSRRLSAFIEEDLQAGEKNLIEEHLKTCSACRRKVADLRLIRETAARLPRQEPGPYFVNRVLCAISQHRNPREILTGWRYRLSLSGVAFVIAASMTFFVIGPPSTMIAESPSGQGNLQAGFVPVIDSATITEKGFPVPEGALKRDMALTEKAQPESLASGPEVLPRQYVQPVSIQKKAKDDRVF